MTDTQQAVALRDEPQEVERAPQSVLGVFGSMSFKAQVAAALPAHIGVEQMMRVALTEVRMNPDLQKCTVPSFMGALLKAAQSGLRPGMFGEGWILPRWNSKLNSLEAQFQPGYMGLAQLAYRSGEVADIVAEPVYAADHFRYQLGSDPKIEHTPDMDAEHHDSDIVAFYAVVKLTNGGRLMKVMPRRDVDAVRDDYGPHTKDGKLIGPWVTNYPAMGAKTVLIQALKLAPKESERLQSALAAEQDAIFGDRMAAGIVDRAPVADRVAERIGCVSPAEDSGDTVQVLDEETGEVYSEPVPEEPAGAPETAPVAEKPTEAAGEPNDADDAADAAFIDETAPKKKPGKLTISQRNKILSGVRGLQLYEAEVTALYEKHGAAVIGDLDTDAAAAVIAELAALKAKRADGGAA